MKLEKSLGMYCALTCTAGALLILLLGNSNWQTWGSALGFAAVSGSWGLYLVRHPAGSQPMASGQQHEFLFFTKEVAPVWSRHIESSRAQMENAVNALSAKFSGIVQELDALMHSANAETQSIEDGSGGFSDVFARNEQELGDVIAQQRNTQAIMNTLLARVRDMEALVADLQGLAADVAKIAQQTNLLSLNAADEASRSGEQGRGFAIVAEEFRMLSIQSGETGQRIADKVRSIQAEIHQTCELADTSVADSEATAQESTGRVARVVADFRGITEALGRSSDTLKMGSMRIQSEVNQALVELQFQDRTSQMMTHVKANIDRMPDFVAEHASAQAGARAAKPLDPHGLLGELKATYVMDDQHVIHHGGEIGHKKARVVTFF